MRTGCNTCKIRRIKCDEQKPACQKCKSTGRNCDGYEDPRQWIVVVSPPSRSPLSDGFEDDKARHFFDLFRSISASELSRFFDGGIWGNLVLQAAHSSPAVRHAVISLASSHEKYKAGPTPIPWNLPTLPKGYIYAAQEYGKAVRHLRKHLSEDSQQNHTTALICGVLFICIEVLQGNGIGALQHLDGCIRMLNEIRSRASLPLQGTSSVLRKTIENEIEDDLLPMFTRLDLEAALFVGFRPPLLEVNFSPLLEPEVSMLAFSNVSEASNSLHSLMIQIGKFIRQSLESRRYRIIGDVPLHVFGKQQNFLRQLSYWERAMDAFLVQLRLEAPQSIQNFQKQITLLQIHHKVTTIWLSTSLQAEETMNDAFIPMFSEIVRLAASLNGSLTVESAEVPQSPPRTFSLETGIIQPLFWVAIKCRDGHIRREAHAELRKCPQEGVWLGMVEAAIANRVIEIEEAGSIECSSSKETFKRAEDIPEWVRIHGVDMTPDTNRRVVKMEYLQRPNGPDGEWDENVEWVTWG